jgi:hypothetical protein
MLMIKRESGTLENVGVGWLARLTVGKTDYSVPVRCYT